MPNGLTACARPSGLAGAHRRHRKQTLGPALTSQVVALRGEAHGHATEVRIVASPWQRPPGTDAPAEPDMHTRPLSQPGARVYLAPLFHHSNATSWAMPGRLVRSLDWLIRYLQAASPLPNTRDRIVGRAAPLAGSAHSKNPVCAAATHAYSTLLRCNRRRRRRMGARRRREAGVCCHKHPSSTAEVRAPPASAGALASLLLQTRSINPHCGLDRQPRGNWRPRSRLCGTRSNRCRARKL